MNKKQQKGINTVGGLIDSLKRFPNSYKIITHIEGSIYDGRILSVHIDQYEKKRNKNVITIQSS